MTHSTMRARKLERLIEKQFGWKIDVTFRRKAGTYIFSLGRSYYELTDGGSEKQEIVDEVAKALINEYLEESVKI